VALCWLGAVASRAALGGAEGWPGVGGGQLTRGNSFYLDVVAFVFASGIFASTMFCLLHFINALVWGIDTYSYHFMLKPDYQQGVHEWNVLQAVLRRASGAMERTFKVCAVTSLLMLFLCAAEVALPSADAAEGPLGGTLPTLVPVVFLVAIMGLVLLKAADVTGRCRRVPPFINSLCFGGDCHLHERQYLVQYIANSAAGFYISEVQLTAAVAIKMVYLGAMAMITIFTKAAASSAS